MYAAMLDAREAAEHSVAAHRKILANPMRTPLDAMRAAREVAFKYFEKAARGSTVLEPAAMPKFSEWRRQRNRQANPNAQRMRFNVLKSEMCWLPCRQRKRAATVSDANEE